MFTKIIAVTFAAVSLAACASITNPARVHTLAPNSSYLADFDASRRGAILLPRPDGKGMGYCAEPSPDVAYNSVLSLVASITQNSGVSGDLQLQFQQSVVELAQRTEVVQVLRESLYRLCEQTLNGTMSEAAVEQQYDTALKTALALAQTDLAKTQAGAAAVSRLSDPQLKALFDALIKSSPTK